MILNSHTPTQRHNDTKNYRVVAQKYTTIHVYMRGFFLDTETQRFSQSGSPSKVGQSAFISRFIIYIQGPKLPKFTETLEVLHQSLILQLSNLRRIAHRAHKGLIIKAKLTLRALCSLRVLCVQPHV